MAAWAALFVALWSLHGVRAAQPSASHREPSSATALSASSLPAGCSGSSAATIRGPKFVDLDDLSPGSTGWITSWAVTLDPAGRAYLSPHSLVSASRGGTATTLVAKGRSGSVSVVQCEPRPFPSDPNLYASGEHLDVGGSGWQPVTVTVPACWTYQLRVRGVMQAEDCGGAGDYAAPHTGATVPKYAIQLRIEGMRPDTSGWTQPWAVIRDQSGKYRVDGTFALEKTRYGTAELQIVKSHDGVLTACLDRELESKIRPSDTYQAKADLPIQVNRVEQGPAPDQSRLARDGGGHGCA